MPLNCLPGPQKMVMTADGSPFTFLVTIINKMLAKHYVQYLISDYELGN